VLPFFGGLLGVNKLYNDEGGDQNDGIQNKGQLADITRYYDWEIKKHACTPLKHTL
jgi:hypothetical protein